MVTGISGFRMRGKNNADVASPEPIRDAVARDTLIGKLRALGDSFSKMSEEEYGNWLNALPQNEFIELIAMSDEK